MFPLHVHLKAKSPTLHSRLQGRLPLAKVYCFSKMWCSREWFIFLCKKHVILLGGKTRWIVRSRQTLFFGATWMLLLRVVHLSSIFEFGAEFHDCLSEDPQGNPPFSPFFGATWMLLLRAVHVSFIFEFGAVFHDCLSEDPQGNPPFSPFFGATWMLLLRAVHVASE